jgi:hypothetical protein
VGSYEEIAIVGGHRWIVRVSCIRRAFPVQHGCGGQTEEEREGGAVGIGFSGALFVVLLIFAIGDR